jgi:rod shape-determining protein MreD
MRRLLLSALAVVAALLADLRLPLRTDLLALLAYCYGLRRGPSGGIFFGAFLGFLEDGLSASILGPAVLAKGMVGYTASFLPRGFFRWSPVLGFLGAFSLTFLADALQYASLGVFWQAPTTLGQALAAAALAGLLNGVLGVFIRPRDER